MTSQPDPAQAAPCAASPVLRRFARTVVRYSLDARAGDLFVIRATTLAVPLVREVHREALEAGAFVEVRLSYDGQEETLHRHATEEQLDWVSPLDRHEMEAADARLVVQAPFNTRSAAGVDPGRLTRRQRALGELSRVFRRRSAEGSLRWCGTLYPTHALAQEADMGLGDYEEFVFRAMKLDREDPAEAWRTVSADQQRKADFLERVQTLRIVAEDTDLTLSVAGRRWINSDGRRNFPSGEVFTGPVEDSARGHIRFTYPAVYGGRRVEDVRLWFENGRVVRAEAARGQEYLLARLDEDAGARFLGEVAVGCNYDIQQFTGNVLFDEKIGGTCHLALGASYPETGGRNDSSLHWDMVCDLRRGGVIYADGVPIHRDGAWMI